jgi:hypothetical protein
MRSSVARSGRTAMSDEAEGRGLWPSFSTIVPPGLHDFEVPPA